MVKERITLAEAFARFPAHQPKDAKEAIRAHWANNPKKVVVLDDDPTGTQTVHGVPVVTTWSVDIFTHLLRGNQRLFYVLTNSRSLSERDAAALTRDLITSLIQASKDTGVPYSIISRSDSTLRGHFPAETNAAIELMEAAAKTTFDGQVLVPAFFEGGRYTFDNTHWVADGDELIPAGETEFAKDPAFGYRASDLRIWVEEKTRGQINRDEVVCISIDTLRKAGADGVCRQLLEAPKGSTIVGNALNYEDMYTLAAGFLRAESCGRQYLYRTAASFVPAYGGIPLKPPLDDRELHDSYGKGSTAGGLVVVGSHVQKTTEQLNQLLQIDGVFPIEVRVDRLLMPDSREAEISRVATQANRALTSGHDTVVYTSREVIKGSGSAEYLRIGEVVASSLVQIVRGLQVQPRFFVAKGGITSSTMITEALEARTALVLGQILKGVPVWKLGAESRMPELHCVIFPGNVGVVIALSLAVQRLRGQPHS